MQAESYKLKAKLQEVQEADAIIQNLLPVFYYKNGTGFYTIEYL
jgi:hypothetical protein